MSQTQMTRHELIRLVKNKTNKQTKQISGGQGPYFLP